MRVPIVFVRRKNRKTHAPPQVKNESGETIFFSVSSYNALFRCHCHTFSTLHFSLAAFVYREI